MHIEHLKTVIGRLTAAGFTINAGSVISVRLRMKIKAALRNRKRNLGKTK
jgi:hypothetical protein